MASWRRPVHLLAAATWLAVLASLGAAGPAASAAAGAPDASPRSVVWTRTPTGDVGAGHNELLGVGYGGLVAWAVGDYYDGSSDRTLAERFTGRHWVVTNTPDVGPKHNQLSGVAGSSTSDVWAVGRYEPLQGQERTLAEHWDGHAWRIWPTPDQGAYHNELDAVVARGPDDVWAVGHWDLHATISDEALVEHFNGLRWSVVPCKHPAISHSGFTGLASVPGTHELWAVGYRIQGSVTRTFAELWNGRSWSIVATPNVGLSHNELDGVTAVSRNDAWAVGYSFLGTADRPLVEHWNGQRWSVVTIPASFAQHETLSGVVAVHANDVIAVGAVYYGTADRTVVLGWNGRHWSVQQSPDAGALHNTLNAVTSKASFPPIAVGVFYSGLADRTLAIRRG